LQIQESAHDSVIDASATMALYQYHVKNKTLVPPHKQSALSVADPFVDVPTASVAAAASDGD